jgi:hypothetical protein
MSNRKAGANNTDIVNIRMMHAQGFEAEQIAESLLINVKTVESFMEANLRAPKKDSKGRVTKAGYKPQFDALQKQLKGSGVVGTGELAELRQTVQDLTAKVTGLVTKTDGLVDDDGMPIETSADEIQALKDRAVELGIENANRFGEKRLREEIAAAEAAADDDI